MRISKQLKYKRGVRRFEDLAILFVFLVPFSILLIGTGIYCGEYLHPIATPHNSR